MAEDEIQVIRGSTITIQVTILQNGSYGTPVQNQRIYYYDQTYDVFLGSSITDQNGVSILDWSIPLHHALGFTVLNATFYGNESLSLAPSHQQVTILVQSETNLEIKRATLTQSVGSTLSATIQLVDDSDVIIPNETLEVKLDGSHLAYITTNSTGIAEFSALVDERFTLGFHELQIQYDGSFGYSQSSIETTIEITSPISISVQMSETAIIGSNYNVEVTILDLLNRSITDSILLLSDLTSGQSVSVPLEGDAIVNLQYIIEGPPGLHNINLEVLENDFIANTMKTANLTVWSNSVIELVESNVDHYASPSQEVSFEIELTDWQGNSSSKSIQLLINSEFYMSEITNTEGFVIFQFTAPQIETQYNISFFYSGNLSGYELSTKLDYNLFVTTHMPIEITLDSYEVIAPLHEISVFLSVRGLNGTLLGGVLVNFNWFSYNWSVESMNDGQIALQLAIPSENGNYFLYYESEPTDFVSSTTGSIMIEVSLNDINSLEGVGITGMIFALFASIGLVTVPIVRRRYLIG